MVLVTGVAVVLFALVAKRINSTPISGPMLFVAGGLLLGGEGLGWIETDLSNSTITVLVEATLAIVLFSDASRIELGKLRHEWGLPGRLLGIGLPLCIAFGVLAALGVLDDLPWEGALLAGIMLAPTDAALGQAVVTDRSVPIYVRQGLNVESGLNDGMVFPLFEVAVTVAMVGLEGFGARQAALDLLREIGFGAVAGVAVGVVSAALLSWSRRNGWTGRHWHGIATIGITAAAYGLALGIGGNGFIAAFAAGLAYRPSVGLPTADDVSHDLAQLLTMLAFIVFGAVVLAPSLGALTWQIAVYALLSLTIVRMVPVGIATLGSHNRLPTIAFVGWFGPRGIASVLYSFLLLESVGELDAIAPVVDVVTLTVALSVLLHGMTAAPLARAYGRWFDSLASEHDEMVESTDVHEHRLGRSADAGSPDSVNRTGAP